MLKPPSNLKKAVGAFEDFATRYPDQVWQVVDRADFGATREYSEEEQNDITWAARFCGAPAYYYGV